jgi:hypothetical protein
MPKEHEKGRKKVSRWMNKKTFHISSRIIGKPINQKPPYIPLEKLEHPRSQEYELLLEDQFGLIQVIQSLRDILVFLSPHEPSQRFAGKSLRTNAAEWNESSPGISIAETSLTTDNIIYATDPGFAKQNTYNVRTNIETLMVDQR